VFELRYFCDTHDYYASRNEPLPGYFVHWQKKLRHLAVGGPGFGHVETSLMGHLRTLKTLTLQDQRKKNKAKSATLLKVVWNSGMPGQNKPQRSLLSARRSYGREERPSR
jgi:hypothetical protein